MALTRNCALFTIVAILGSFTPAAAIRSPITLSINASTGPVTNLTYSCDGNGSYDLSINALTNFDFCIITDGNITANTTACTQTLQNVSTATNVTLRGCTRTPYVYVMKNHSAQLAKVLGGRNFLQYELDCKLPYGGVIQNVSMSFGVKEPAHAPEAGNPNFNLTMVFKHEANWTYTNFTLNEKMFLDIRDNSAVVHQLHLLRCDASSRPGGLGDTANIYDININNGTSEMFEKVTTPTLGDVNVELRAFRFVSSFTTYIKCSVRVCNANETCSTTSRKRRDVDSSEPTSVVDGSFTVVQSGSESPAASGQTTVLPWHALVMSILAFVVAAYATRREGQ